MAHDSCSGRWVELSLSTLLPFSQQSRRWQQKMSRDSELFTSFFFLAAHGVGKGQRGEESLKQLFPPPGKGRKGPYCCSFPDQGRVGEEPRRKGCGGWWGLNWQSSDNRPSLFQTTLSTCWGKSLASRRSAISIQRAVQVQNTLDFWLPLAARWEHLSSMPYIYVSLRGGALHNYLGPCDKLIDYCNRGLYGAQALN